MQLSGVKAAFGGGGNGAVWYVLFILCMYALYPVLHCFFSRSRAAQRRAAFVACMAFPYLCGELLIRLAPEAFRALELERWLSKMPVFVLGAFMGRAVEEGRRSRKALVPLLFALFVLLRLLKITLLGPGDADLRGPVAVRVANQCLAFAVMLSAAMLMERRSGAAHAPFRRVLSWCGRASLELYLFHSFFILIYGALPFRKDWYMYFAVLLPLSFLASACALAATVFASSIFLQNPMRNSLNPSANMPSVQPRAAIWLAMRP